MKNLNNYFKTIVVLFAIFIGTTNFLKAQDSKVLSMWSLSLNGGATLTWGDMSDDVTNPFSKYFTNQQGYAIGIIGTRHINSIFDINLQAETGKLQGSRYNWGGNVISKYRFVGNFSEFNLNLNVDLINLLFKNKDDRFFNLYLKGGVGYTLYNSTKTSIDRSIDFPAMKGGALVIPWGGGIRLKLNRNFSFFFENTFSYAFSDELDGHVGVGTDLNDIYNFTSVGATYRFNQIPKKPKVKMVEETPVDTVFANTNENNEVENDVVENVSVVMTKPNDLYPNSTFDVKLRINKSSLAEKARLQQTLPVGMTAISKNSSGAQFNFEDQIVSFKWDNLESESSIINLEYTIVTKDIIESEYTIPGIFFYDKNGKENIVQFRESMFISKPIVAKTEISTPVVKTETQPIVETKTINGLVFKVQLQAIYGGKSSPKSVAKANNITMPVEEEVIGAYTKYTAGNFTSYEEAKALKDQIRMGKNQGAFVVAYYNGKRITINEAIDLQSKANKNELNINSSPVKQETIDGISYRIQIGASAKSKSIVQLQSSLGSNDRITETKHNSLYKYVIGNYTTSNEANSKLLEVRKHIPDAFIVKFKNGIRFE